MAFSENNKSRVVCFSKRHSICKSGKENLNVELELFSNTLNSENWVFEALERGSHVLLFTVKAYCWKVLWTCGTFVCVYVFMYTIWIKDSLHNPDGITTHINWSQFSHWLLNHKQTEVWIWTVQHQLCLQQFLCVLFKAESSKAHNMKRALFYIQINIFKENYNLPSISKIYFRGSKHTTCMIIKIFL